ncbi:phage tail tape measure protein [Corynebacterium coyleae]|uniref:phage tail tape measure protein n=1 Tax=Corynebacterium coyleae TaxID=53374 RepID=UPI00254A2F5C|nr:phage tail tape measure protein [Corynebacterium coyleae]MDK8242588.1 phage tail tape measure protein [Corynebacterium coyleae]
MSAVGYASIPVTLSFANASREIQSKLKPQLDKLSKDASKSIDKGVGSSAAKAADKVEKANWRVKKSAEELSDAQSKLKAEQSKAKAAALELSLAEQKLADLKASGTASSEELLKAESNLEKKRARAESATQNVEKAERGLEKAMTENARAAESLEKAQSGATDATAKFGDAAADADVKGQGFELSLKKVAAAGAVIAGAIGGAAKAAYDIGASFDDAYDTIRVGTGASGAAFEDLQESMRNVARDSIGVGSDMGEIGTTLADLNTRLGVTGEPLEKLTTQFQQLKGMGMETDINAMAGAFQQFGVEVEDMPAMLDSVFQISQATGRDMTALVDNLSKSGPALREFGFGLEESAGLLGALDKAGLDADKTMNSMTKALSEFAKEGKDPQRELWGMISKIDELTAAGKSAEAIDLANSIFGARGGAGFVAAVESGTFAYDDFMDSLGASSDTIGGLAAETADFAERWDQFKLQAMLAIEPVAAMVFDAMVPALDKAQGAFEAVSGAVQGFGEWVQKSKDWLIPLGAGLTVVAGGLAAIALQQKIVAAGGLLKWLSELTVVTKLQTAAQAALNLVMNANPIMLVVTAVAALTAGLVVFFTKTETGQRIWQNFTEALGNLWEGFKERTVQAISNLISKFNEWRNNTQLVISAVKGFFTSFGDKVKETSSRAIDAVKSIPTGIKNAFKGAATWLVDAGRQMISGLIDGIKSMAGKVGDAVRWVVPDRLERFVPGLHFGGLTGFARGGVLPDIPGVSRSERDPILGYSRERKTPIARIEPGEFVVNREATAKHLPLLYAINEGKYDGKRVDGLPGYASGGVIGAMTKLVKDAFPMLQVTSAYRPGDSGYHGRGLAVDFSNGTGNTPQQLALAKAINRVYPESAQLIYAAPGWSGNIYEGRPAGAMDSGIYKTAQAGRHDHHVHWAMKTPPTKPLNGPAGSSGGATQGPANLPAMKWSENGLTVNAVRAGRAIALQFPEVKTIGGYRPVDPYPDHPSGRALDVMTYTDQALGDRILNYLFDNNGFFKMQYAIWKQAMWYKKGAPQPMADRGSPTQNHMDHVHAYFEASPRANGSETYPNLIGAGGVSAARDAGDALIGNTGAVEEAKSLRQISSKNIDYGTAAQLATKWETDARREEGLREYLKRKAKVYDTGGILPTGGVAVNLGKPELIFPAEATTAMLQMARETPQFAAAMQVLSAHVPQLAAAIDKFTDLDYGAIAEEVSSAWRNEDSGYGELARAVGEEAAERIVTEIAFIGDQIRDMQDGSNMRAYLSSMSASEAVGLADQVGQLAGISGIGSTFGGVAKGYEALQDAAVMQVDAADAVKQAEENLADVRRQAAEITGDADASEDEKAAAVKAVTAAEAEHSKALGVVKMAAKATGQAQIAMALEVAEMVIGIGKQIWDLAVKITDWINNIRIQTRNAVWELTKSWSELTGVVDQHRGMVSQLQMQLVNAALDVIGKSMEMRTAQVDVVRAQLQGAKNVAEAEAALQAERDKAAGRQKWNFRDMSLEYDRFRDGYRLGMSEQIAGMTHLSEQERERILSTLTGVGQLGDEERARVFGAVAGMSDLDVREKERITAALAGVGELTVEERARVANAIANMGDLSAEERERIIRAINGVTEVAEEERLRVVAALTGLGRIDGKQQDLTNQIVANVDKEGLAVKLGLDAKLAAQRAADDAYVASVQGREVGERELHQMYKLQLAEQLVGEQAFQDLKDASLDAQLEWQARVDKAAQLGLEAELKARAVVTPEILALQREVYAAEFAQQKSILDAQIKGIEATFAQQQALVTMGRLQEDLIRQQAELDRLSGQTMGMNQGQAIVMEEIARLQAQNAEIMGQRDSFGAKARNFFGRIAPNSAWGRERAQYDAAIAANNRQIAELQKSAYAKGAFTPAQQRQIDEATKLAAKYFAQGNEAAAKAALAASPLGNAQRSLEVDKTLSRITDWEKQQRELQRGQQDALAEFKKNTRLIPLEWESQELASREARQRYAADALRSDNDGVRDALATLSRLEESNAAELKQLREKPTVVNVTVPGPRDGVTTIGEMEDALVALAGELGVTRTDVKRLNEARRTSASDRVRAAIGKY